MKLMRLLEQIVEINIKEEKKMVHTVCRLFI